jgi:hypothetical protein
MDERRPSEVVHPKSRGFKLLTSDERRRVLRRLRQRWPPTEGRDWWHPFDAMDRETETLELESGWLAVEVSVAEFRRRAALRWSKFWVLGEGTPHFDDPRPSFQGEYEVSAAYISPTMSNETICAPRSLAWLVYTDHNDRTILVGQWLVEKIKDVWPTWERHIWTTPFHEQPSIDEEDEMRPWWA